MGVFWVMGAGAYVGRAGFLFVGEVVCHLVARFVLTVMDSLGGCYSSLI